MTPAPPGGRVAQVGPDPHGRGGMEAVLAGLLSSPLASAYRFEAIVTYRTPSPLRRVTVFARALVALARWCRGDGRRVVHVHTAVRGSIYRKALCVLVAKQAGRPVILHVHAGAGDIEAFAARLGPLRTRMLAAAIGAADVVVSVSAASAGRIAQEFGVADATVIPNAAPAIDRRQGRDPSASGRRLLFMGGFDNAAKGGALLAQALPQLLEEVPDLEAVLAGSGAPPPGLADPSSQGAIRWRGWLDRESTMDELSRCDVFVMPSISEGMPIALLEAMACRRAIVATAVGGIPDVVVDGRDAVLVPPGDAGALARAVGRVLCDDDLRRSLAAGAGERVKEFSPAVVHSRYAAVYDDLLTRTSSR